jgi:hypothetical protein
VERAISPFFKDYSQNELVKKFLEKYGEVRGTKKAEELTEKTVGNNGYSIGQTFTLLGTIDFKEQTINGSETVYWYLPTKEGVDLSLMSLMGVSSLKGYVDKNIEVEYYLTKKEDGKNVDDKKSRTVTPDFTPEDDFKKVWQPPTRHLLTLVAMIADGDENMVGKKVTFLGTAVKPFTAKSDNEQNGEKYRAGYQRAIETKLWSIN